MGNSASATMAVAGATNRANKMLGEAKDQLGLGDNETSADKMKSIKKEDAEGAANRNKRRADRQKEFDKKKQEREKNKASIQSKWAKGAEGATTKEETGWFGNINTTATTTDGAKKEQSDATTTADVKKEENGGGNAWWNNKFGNKKQ